MKTKICSTCKIRKPMSQYYTDKRRKSGFYSRCKKCHLIATARYSKTFRGKEAQRKYWRSDYGKKKHRERAEKYNKTKKGQETIRRWMSKNWRRYYDPNDEKIRARWTVVNNVRQGKIPPAKELLCKVCNKQAKEYHHHKGYDKSNWLEIIPLCIPCHKKVDRKGAKKNIA